MTGVERKKNLDQELGRIVQVLVNQYRPQKIFLFGSLASGKVHEWSDIDLVIIKSTPLRFLDRIKEVLFLIRPKVGCDVMVYTPEEFRHMLQEGNQFLQDEIQNNGRVLYEAA